MLWDIFIVLPTFEVETGRQLRSIEAKLSTRVGGGDLPEEGIWYTCKKCQQGTQLTKRFHAAGCTESCMHAPLQHPGDSQPDHLRASFLVMQPKKAVVQQDTASRQPLQVDAVWEEQPSASTSDEEVPEEISARILRRIIIFSGIPTFTGFLSLPLFYYLKVLEALRFPAIGQLPLPLFVGISACISPACPRCQGSSLNHAGVPSQHSACFCKFTYRSWSWLVICKAYDDLLPVDVLLQTTHYFVPVDGCPGAHNSSF